VTVVGLDDTDSREAGMCTTYAAALVAERLRREARVFDLRLVRLSPAVPYKTRGNAALAVHTDADPGRALAVARDVIDREAATGDDRTAPGVVVAPGSAADVPDAVADFSWRAGRELVPVARARRLVRDNGYASATWGGGQGLVGALAAVGAARAWEGRLDPTYETIAYREPGRRGTDRAVEAGSVFAAADEWYPTVWDTVDRATGETVCVPHTPGPVLYGIRGDDPDACRRCADAIDSEPVERRETFVTNQGTDAHVRPGRLGACHDGRAYRVTGTVVAAPETRRGGHVFLAVGRSDGGRGDGGTAGEDGSTLPCAAFEPTGRFRDRVRALRVGDRVTVAGEVTDGTCKLEKFAVRGLVRTERVTPTCPGCERRMSSAGRGQGYRCRDCGTSAPGKDERTVERALEPGWYEVPPTARRHVAKPLVRGGFDAPVHPER
jgi:tRNA(Ile2)-agmatinylcytidine synthase